MLAPVQEQPKPNREQRRAMKKRPATRKHQDKTALNPVLIAVFEADFQKRFTDLKLAADRHCIAGEDIGQAIYHCGFLLFVVLRALNLENMHIEEQEVIAALSRMGETLGDMRIHGEFSPAQRKVLMDGMDYLVALIPALTKQAAALAWVQVEQAMNADGMGTHDLAKMLQRFNS